MMMENIAGDHEVTNAFISATCQNPIAGSNINPTITKKKRNLPGTPDPEAEVIALSPKTLMATNRFLCEICGKGFQRDQNLQLHRRGHNLPWKLRQRTSKEPRKRVYVCPEKSCVHHHPSRALGDLTGIKKHFCRKHGEKKWKCDKCSKRYAVQSDWKAHSKTCGTREYRCDCGTLFSRRDSFITHRAFCDALAEETARVTAVSNDLMGNTAHMINYHHLVGTSSLPPNMLQHFSSIFKLPISSSIPNSNNANHQTSTTFSLWMNQSASNTDPLMSSTTTNSLQELHQIGSLYSDPFESCTSNHHQQQLNWVFGGKQHQQQLSSSSSSTIHAHGDHQLLISSSSSSLHAENKGGSDHPAINTAPSLYSTAQHLHSSSSSATAANMSATALLQKAAQIGATSSACATEPLSFGCSNFKGNNNKYNNHLLFGSNSTFFTSMGSTDHHHHENDSGLNNLKIITPPISTAKLQINQTQKDDIGEQTRDFLGVGTVQAICSSSSINEWM